MTATASMLKLQETCLNQLRKQKHKVAIYLANGIKLQGIIHSFDQYMLILEGQQSQQMVYKSAISTIAPDGKFMFDLSDPSPAN